MLFVCAVICTSLTCCVVAESPNRGSGENVAALAVGGTFLRGNGVNEELQISTTLQAKADSSSKLRSTHIQSDAPIMHHVYNDITITGLQQMERGNVQVQTQQQSEYVSSNEHKPRGSSSNSNRKLFVSKRRGDGEANSDTGNNDTGGSYASPNPYGDYGAYTANSASSEKSGEADSYYTGYDTSASTYDTTSASATGTATSAETSRGYDSYGSYGSSTSSYGDSSSYGGSYSSTWGSRSGTSSSSKTSPWNTTSKFNTSSLEISLIPAIFVLILVSLIGMLITAHHMEHDPEGNYANCCRVSLHSVSCVYGVIYNLYHCRLSEIPQVVFASEMEDGEDYTDEELERMRLRPGIERALDVEHRKALRKVGIEINKIKVGGKSNNGSIQR